MRETHFSILHGEDDEADVETLEHILETINYSGDYQNLDLGQTVLDRLFFKNQFADDARLYPDLILLDIGLPGVSGKDILKALRADYTTQHIPVLMMSGSVSDRDFRDCIKLGCNGYIQKNEHLDTFTENCQLMIKGWIGLTQQSFV